MSKYTDFWNRQTPSEDLHRRLLEIPKGRRPRVLPYLAAAAACTALAAGLLWRGAPAEQPMGADQMQAATVSPEAAPAGTADTQPGAKQLPEIRYAQSSSEVAADIALPEGYFYEALTQEDLEALFGGTGWWEELGWSLEGQATYDGYGQLWQASLSGTDGGDGWYSLSLAPGHLPPACIATEPDSANDIWGTQVFATCNYFDCDGDGIEEYRYTLTFLRDEILGARLEVTSQTQAQDLIDALLSRLLDPDREVSLDFLVPEEIPQWRSKRLTWQEALAEPDFAAYVPQSVPAGFQPESFHLELGQNRYNMSLLWHKGYDDLSITIDLEPQWEYYGDFLADPDLPESYDVRLYDIPWGENVPEAYWNTINDPIFQAEDMTADLLAARAQRVTDWGDSDSPRFAFRILYPDGALVGYRAEIPLEDLWALIEPTLP